MLKIVMGKKVSATADNISTLELNYDDNNINGYSAKLWNSWVSNYHYANENYDYNTLNFVVNKKNSLLMMVEVDEFMQV